MLKSHIIQGWPHEKDEVKQSMKHYWPIMHELAMISGIAMEGTIRKIPFLLQRQTLKQFFGNNIIVEKIRLLVREWVLLGKYKCRH